MAENVLARELETVRPHDHVCLVQHPIDEWPAKVIVPFLEHGLCRGERCLYVLEAHRADEVRNHLRRAGIDVAGLQAAGQLVFSENESYTKSLSFEPNRVIAILISEAERAVAQGYSSLRVTDEMTWALPGRPGSEKVMEYEAKLNRDFFPRYPCLALCQYDRSKFDSETIKGALRAHPLVVHGHHIHQNRNYVSPDGFLGKANAQLEVECLLKSLDRDRQSEERVRSVQETLQEIAHAIEARDPFSAGHQRRVTRLVCAIAKEMGVANEETNAIREAGLLHDIGKIYVSTDILTKPGKLTEEEFAKIKVHPQWGFDLLRRMTFPPPIPEIVLQHHERLDGSGYPQHLSGEDIILGARILAVADVVEAMSLGRSYRGALGIAKALQDISWNKGSLYDTEVVEACLRLFTDKGYRFQGQ